MALNVIALYLSTLASLNSGQDHVAPAALLGNRFCLSSDEGFSMSVACYSVFQKSSGSNFVQSELWFPVLRMLHFWC